jgi:type I restriction enzyme S subunit
MAGEREKSELPSGWCWATVGEVCESIEYGLTASASEGGAGPRMLRITDITEHGVDWSSVPRCHLNAEPGDRFLLRDGDIVFARTGATTGKSYLVSDVPQSVVFASYLIRLRARAIVTSERFLSLFFQSPMYWSAIATERAGIAQPNVNGSKLASLVVPLPPLAEQRRIVAKLEELLGRIRRARAALDAVPAMVERYKKSVLGAAFRDRAAA